MLSGWEIRRAFYKKAIVFSLHPVLLLLAAQPISLASRMPAGVMGTEGQFYNPHYDLNSER